MNRIIRIPAILALLLIPPALSAQSPSSIDELRRELAAARAELAAARERLDSLEQKLQRVNAPSVAPASPAPAQKPLRQEPAKPAERLSVRLGSVARATFYGQIYANAFFNSSQVNFNDIPMFTVPAVGAFGGRGSLGVAARQTRFGIRLDEMKVGSAKATAVVEADFYGGFPNVGTGENFALPRLRLANLRLDWTKTSLLVGQDWVMFAPLNPQSIAAAAVPPLAAVGNLWQRMTQLRLERLEEFSGGKLLLQAAVVAPATGDFPTTTYVFALQPSSGSRSQMPFWQGRVAFTPKRWIVKDRFPTWGVSAHYGLARGLGNTGEARITSAGIAADWMMPLGAGFVFSGEGFFGRNLAAFQGGAFQGANFDFMRRYGSSLIRAGARAIGTRGGWAQLSFTPAVVSALTLNGAYGMDDPRDADLLASSGNLRTRNQAFFVNFIYKSSPNLTWGLEYRRTNTTQQVGRTLANDHINLGFQLSF